MELARNDDRLGLGGNKPPDMASTVLNVASDLNTWLKNHPVIESEEDAREAKPYIDRAKLAVADLEAERKGKTGPLNEQVAAINSYYKTPRETLERILAEISLRLARYMAEEEARRQQAADVARQAAAEAERKAREAETKEREALADAQAGELDVDVLALTKEADESFSRFQRAQRLAALADRESDVRIGGGLGRRALSLRSHETLVVTDWQKAIEATGCSEDIQTAICKTARAWRKLHGKLPAGVEAEVERKI